MGVAEADLAALLKTLDPHPGSRDRQFEEICRWYLLNDHAYSSKLKHLWLCDEWPGRWGDQAGIDLVAKSRNSHPRVVQAKAYEPGYSIKKADIDSFLSESARPGFSFRLSIATNNNVARLGERTMPVQEKPVAQLLFHDLERAAVTWPSSIADLRPGRSERRNRRPDEEEAIDAVLKDVAEGERGQLIMACGTGKTVVFLWVGEVRKAGELGANRVQRFEQLNGWV